MPKVYITPSFDQPDRGEGGIRRVVEAQVKYLPRYGWDIAGSLEEADLLAVHGVMPFPINVKIPVVAHLHGAYWAEYAWPKWALDANVAICDTVHRADAVTSPSEWVSRIITREFWRKSPVLTHGIEPEEFEPGENKGYVLWNKTRVDSICDPNPVIELAKLAPDAKFLSTYGQPSHNLEIVGLQPHDKAMEQLRSAGVYLATARETYGIGILEAMAYGVPILGFAWGGIREIVTHKEHGWLAIPGDYDGLREGLAYCIDNHERLSKAARQSALKKHTWREKILAYANLYNTLIKSKKAGPKVSVIITCYNLAEFLPRAVKSVESQGFDDYEVIIVDDASPDDTPDVSKRLAAANPKVRVVRNDTNLYLAGALNRGISESRGEYILCLDADNELGDETLIALSGALDSDKSLDVAYGSLRLVEPNKDFVSDWPPSTFNYMAQISHKNQIHSSAMYRRVWWERSGGYRRRCRTAEDADYWSRITSIGARPAKVTEAVSLIYHNRQESMSNTVRDWAWHNWTPWHKREYAHLLPYVASKTAVYTKEPVKITVIVPVGPGHEELVIDAVDSLVAQTYQNWDCIVINDSGKKLPWVHPFVRVISTGQEGGKGPAFSRNLGVKVSSTPLWVPLDADDFLQPEALELLYRAYEPGYFVYSDYFINEKRELRTTPEYSCQDLLTNSPYPVTCLYSKDDWVKAGGYDESLPYEDWDFFINLASIGVCGIRVPHALLNYRVSRGSRRESTFERRDEARKEIETKWSKFITGEEKLMACGGCGQRRVTPGYTSVLSQRDAIVTLSNNGATDAVLMEYTGLDAPRTYKSQITGAEYRFGSDQYHKIKYVLKQDVSFFLARPNFELREDTNKTTPATEMLEAAGPPTR